MQDNLALRLLNGRGYGAWRAGTINDVEFAHRLSMEWASLPDPVNGGKSHYDGDSAGNHASCTLDAVYAMLKAAKAGGAVPHPPNAVTRDSVDAAIRGLQLAVKVAGYYTGIIDGKFGPQSQAALTAWQAANA